MADTDVAVYEGPVAQLTVVPLSERIPNRTMGHVALFGLDGLPFVGGGGAGLNPRGVYDEAAEYEKGDYVMGAMGSEEAIIYWLATEDHPAGEGPTFGAEGWAILGLSEAAFQAFTTLLTNSVGSLQTQIDEKVNHPVSIADLGFDPGTQAELDAAVSAAVTSLTTELNLKTTKTELTDGLAPKATKVYVDAELLKKIDKTVYDARVTAVDEALATKQLAKPKLYVKGRGQITTLGAIGHSLMAGVALADPTNKRPSAQFAALATGVVDDKNIAVGGTDLLYADPSSGGWGALIAAYDLTNAATVVPNLWAIWSGLNGVANFYAAWAPGNSADFNREACISLMRARPGSFKKADHGSFAYSTGQWAAGTVDASIGNQQTMYTAALEGTVTETVTLTESSVHVMSFIQNAAFGGSKWEIKEGSTVLGTVDATAVTYGGYHLTVLRIPLLAGNHTLTATCKAVGTNVGFAFFHASWDERIYPPVVLDTLQYKPMSYAGYANAPRVPNDADVDMLNTRIRAVAGLFDDFVIPVPTAPLIEKQYGRLAAADALHLTDTSSQLPAIAWLKALQSSPVVSTNPL